MGYKLFIQVTLCQNLKLIVRQPDFYTSYLSTGNEGHCRMNEQVGFLLTIQKTTWLQGGFYAHLSVSIIFQHKTATN